MTPSQQKVLLRWSIDEVKWIDWFLQKKREAQLLQRRTNRQELKRNAIYATTAFHVQDHPAAIIDCCCSSSQNPHQIYIWVRFSCTFFCRKSLERIVIQLTDVVHRTIKWIFSLCVRFSIYCQPEIAFSNYALCSTLFDLCGT